MSRDSLSIGDTGMVNKDDQGRNWILRAVVIATPSGPGDAWGFRDLESGRDIFTCETFTFYRDAATPSTGTAPGES